MVGGDRCCCDSSPYLEPLSGGYCFWLVSPPIPKHRHPPQHRPNRRRHPPRTGSSANSSSGNAFNSSDQGQNNRWDDGGQGNYWDKYAGRDANGDGIGDTPYPVSLNGTDRYPLMAPPAALLGPGGS
ncbi:MAG: hypothetical protein EXR67_04415 [Dehalococcoidia bacterium]|nr:hypothetical protein [Dehalococcoidia bacterium]